MNSDPLPESQLPTPQVPTDSQSMELLRVWLVDGAPYFVITPHLWNDPAAWGLLLADILRHLGNAYEADGKDRGSAIARMKEAFDAEWKDPTSSADPAV
jgi:hypothetical protein